MRTQGKRRKSSLAALFFLLMLGVAAVLVCGVLLFARFSVENTLGTGAPDLNPAERAVLSAYLAARARDLARPAGPDPTPAAFSVEPGETAAAVAARLAEAGLVRDAELLTYYLRYEGIDDQVEAGDFILRQTMTIPQVARALTDARAREVIVRITEGWRQEQIVEALQQHSGLAGVAADFQALAGPGGARAATYPFLAELGPGASLEGYLFPDTYLLHPTATAAEIIDKMLANFAARLPPTYQADLAARGLTLHQVITVASLIEREAVVEDERPLIASVIYNRLAVGQPLEIDATVQYALGTQGDWWPRLGALDLRAVSSPYNTYAVAGLPPGPIANPGLSSIMAALHPATTSYYYYRALCDGSGRHVFAETYEQHIANACGN
jgi:UPF0755 protein